MKKICNTYTTVPNYCTGDLQKTLNTYAQNGFTLVSTTMAKNKYGVEVMYLFFTQNK